jgi:tape measure domain-containing protein
MSTIEERIVAMKFDGAAFLTGVDKSLTALDKLNSKLKMTDGTKGFSDIGSAADKQVGALSRIASGVEAIGGKFKAMGTIGLAALSTISAQAVFAGENLVKSLAFGPITDGFHEYETNLNAIQTILSNTASAGTNLKDVNKALNELNHYSDQTIYNFAEMAKNIGTFTAAGVDLNTSVASIKGLANLAALSGSSADQASTAMYQLSQAISSGKVSLEDWNSVVNAGLGGTVFQRALTQNAEKMGTLNKGAVKLSGSMKNVTVDGKSFRDSITAKPGQQSWLTSKVLTQTLKQFSGDLTDAQLKAEGFNAAEIKAIQTQAKMAKNAATQVKTLSQLVGTIRESIGSGWTQTWATVFGDFNESKTLFTRVNNVLGGFVTASANSRNKILADWKTLGGRTAVIKSVENAFEALLAVTKPIRDAFREIFPAITGKQLADMSKSLERFTASLKIGGTTANNLKRTFAGFFAVLDIGWQIVKKLGGVILDLLGVATKGSGGFLNFTGNIGDFLVGIDKAIKGGTGLTTFFNTLTKILAAPIRLIKTMASYLASLFDGFSGAEAAKNVSNFAAKLNPLGKLGAIVAVVWGHALVIFQNIYKDAKNVGEALNKVFGGLGDEITNALTGMNFDDFLKTVQTGLLGAIVILIKKFIDHLKGSSSGAGFLDTLKEGIEGLTGTLSAMQNTLKAATLLEIAIAIGILSVSMNVLSKIDAGGLTRASIAITTMFTQLVASLIIFQKVSGFAGFAKMPFVAGAMILLATAVVILASAVTKLAKLDWNGLAKGLTGVVVILGALVGVMQLMPDPKRMISTGIGMIALAVGVRILVSSVQALAKLSWAELLKGLVGVGLILAGLTFFTKFAALDKASLSSGAGILLMAVALKIITSALGDLGKMSWPQLLKGLFAMAAALLILTGVMDGMEASLPGAAALAIVAASLGLVAKALQVMGDMSWSEIGKSMVVLFGSLLLIAAGLAAMEEALPGAAALIVAAQALGILAKAMVIMGGMSWGDIAKSLTVLAASLILIAAAMIVMTEALPGAAALIVVAAALNILVPALQGFASMSWGDILKSMVALAAAFLVISVGGLLLAPVVPILIAFGAAALLIGAGLLLAGAGLLLFGAGLALVAGAGVGAASAIVGIITTLLGGLPQIVKLVGALLDALLDLITNAAPKIGAAATAIMGALLEAIDKNGPKIINTMLHLASSLVAALLKYAPSMASNGAKLIVALLNGLASRIGSIVTAGTNVVIAFINGVSANSGRVASAAVKMVISFVNSTANAIRGNSGAMRAAGLNLALAIIDGMTGGLASGVGRVIGEAKNIASSAISAAKGILKVNSPSKVFIKIGQSVNEGFVKGLKSGDKSKVDSAFNSLRDQVKNAMTDSEKSVDSLTSKLKKLQGARHKDRDEINATKKALAQAKKEHSAESAAYTEITKKQTANQKKLDTLSASYTTLTTKIKAATDAYNDAVKTRDDFNTSITQQFSDIATPATDTTAADYIANLQKQVADTKDFATKLQQLRKLGLNDETYKDLLGAGITDLPFVTDLLNGGKTQIDQINALDKTLNSTAASLGKSASTALYQAAVDSAAGLVKGLQNQQAAIQKQMDIIADAMVKSIKKKLGIKSPSRVFAEVGKFSAQGLSNGLADNGKMVADTASSVGDNAVEAMRVSLSKVNNMIAGNINVQPTIRPVLDLTDIQKNASKIGTLIPSTASLGVSGALVNARSTAASLDSTNTTDTPTNPTTGAPAFNYTQNNYSPKALSSVEIYRTTKNQLSTLKGALST